MSSFLGRMGAAGSAVLAIALAATAARAGGFDGRKLIDQVYGQNLGNSRAMHATLEVFDHGGHSQRKRFVLYSIGDRDHLKSLLVFESPPELRGVKLLSVTQGAQGTQQWILTLTTKRLRSLPPRERSARFAGSDFTFEDITEPVRDNFIYSIVSDAERIDSQPATLVEAKPVTAQASQYELIRYWVARDIPCIVFSEMRDSNDRIVRTLRASHFAKRSGVWGPRRLEAHSLLEGTKSVMTIDQVQINAGLKDEMFTIEAIESSAKARAVE